MSEKKEQWEMGYVILCVREVGGMFLSLWETGVSCSTYTTFIYLITNESSDWNTICTGRMLSEFTQQHNADK